MADDCGTLIDVRLSGDRAIWCSNYVVAYSYEGYMIRPPSEDCNEDMLESLRYKADRCFGDGWPVHVIRPGRRAGEIDYPPVRVMAFFTSLPMRQEMHLSSLVLVWFQREPFPVPDEASRAALEAIVWEKSAIDYET